LSRSQFSLVSFSLIFEILNHGQPDEVRQADAGFFPERFKTLVMLLPENHGRLPIFSHMPITTGSLLLHSLPGRYLLFKGTEIDISGWRQRCAPGAPAPRCVARATRHGLGSSPAQAVDAVQRTCPTFMRSVTGMPRGLDAAQSMNISSRTTPTPEV